MPSETWNCPAAGNTCHAIHPEIPVGPMIIPEKTSSNINNLAHKEAMNLPSPRRSAGAPAFSRQPGAPFQAAGFADDS